MNERGPGQPGPDDFEQRWQALADQLAREMPGQPPDAETTGQTGRSTGSGGAASDAGLPGPAAGLGPTPIEPFDVDWDDDWDGQWPDAETAAAPAVPPGPRDWAEPEAADHFIPEDPPPVFQGEPILVVAWVGFLGGLLAVLAWAIFRPHVDVWFARFGLAALVVGVVLLFWRMPHRRDPEDTDTGARL